MDGLRAVCEPPHIATVDPDTSKVSVFTISPNDSVPVDTAAEASDNTVIANVGDGIQPALTTTIANNIGYDEFRESLMNAKITDRNARSSVRFMVPHMDPATTFPSDE